MVFSPPQNCRGDCWEQSKSSQWIFLCSRHYLPSAQSLYKPNEDGCADSTITNHQPLCFCYKATGPGCLLLCTAACLFPPSERCQATSLPPPPPPWCCGIHTFVQPLCLVLFRLLKCSSFCWSPYQHNQMTAAGTEPNARPSPWHQTRRPVWIPSLIRRLHYPNNFNVFSLSQLPFSFNWIPWDPSILVAPKHSPQSYQSALDNKFLSFFIKSTGRWKKKKVSHWVEWAS